jgi:hypothetical protein
MMSRRSTPTSKEQKTRFLTRKRTVSQGRWQLCGADRSKRCRITTRVMRRVVQTTIKGVGAVTQIVIAIERMKSYSLPCKYTV